ncbi:hypothetical protein SCL_0963 [Sulfuricaulis limicola]|uniref:DUF2878 domain-containing protein n=1 Tax=Sulfuricaulis limicola TaxID=1620215 RepID=A0A1B4XEQ1_9GAMM|nr:hypothetical protein [Sulfuricaulis limicola]BAV33279.1 hypothetical protein SCL_0963 [Sulfuricaulis limicola]
MQNTIQNLITWMTSAALLNSLWELAQLPLYGLWSDPDGSRIVAYLIHCILGDVSIATVLFFLTSMILKSLDWPAVHPWRGGALVIGLGIAYTAFSEWYNVYVVTAWSYAPSMPLIGGIGIAPLLQWFVVPALMIIAMRRLH